MSEEEKEAIDIVKYFENFFTPYIFERDTLGVGTLRTDYDLKDKINKLLKYIDRLQKENNNLKDKVKFYKEAFDTTAKEFEELRIENDKSKKEEIKPLKRAMLQAEEIRKQIVDRLCLEEKDFNKTNADDSYIQAVKKAENAKWYVHQMIARINEDIVDYIDDDKETNKNIILELKETREQWKDVEKLLNGESKDDLYNDWRKYGEYE